MNLLVTGGMGSVGRAVVKRLAASGHSLRVLDRLTGEDTDQVTYAAADITNYDALRPHFDGVEAVVHLAAIIAPTLGTPETIFKVNALGTFNVFQAAASAGIRRVVCASSINALGFNFAMHGFQLDYFPIDEDHPSLTSDAYSFSKCIGEEIGAYFWRREGITSLHLRLTGVYDLEQFSEAEFNAYMQEMRAAYRALFELPENERQAVVQRALQRFESLRPLRASFSSINSNNSGKRWEEWTSLAEADPDMHRAGLTYILHSDFWTAVDVRDAAQAVERSLLAEAQGSHPLFITAADQITGTETERLLQLFFPQVQKRTRPIPGTQTPVSIDRARQLIGYAPEYRI
jgi:nucleoside-diphosphate-sugar epimerase